MLRIVSSYDLEILTGKRWNAPRQPLIGALALIRHILTWSEYGLVTSGVLHDLKPGRHEIDWQDAAHCPTLVSRVWIPPVNPDSLKPTVRQVRTSLAPGHTRAGLPEEAGIIYTVRAEGFSDLLPIPSRGASFGVAQLCVLDNGTAIDD